MNFRRIYEHNERSYRSGLEDKINKQLQLSGIAHPQYEPWRLAYIPKTRHYTPDFVLPNGIIIETKGYFASEDRTKHLLIKAQYPNLDLRFIFTRAQSRLSKHSETTYALWCTKHGFLFAEKRIPDEWLREPLDQKRIDAIKEAIDQCAKSKK